VFNGPYFPRAMTGCFLCKCFLWTSSRCQQNTRMQCAYFSKSLSSQNEDAHDFPPEAHRTILAVDDDAGVVGHLSAYVREVDLENTSLTLGMIGNVATSCAFKRQGVAKSLVNAAHCYFQSLQIDFSVLFAYEPAVYSSSGYRLMRNKVHFQDDDGQWKTFVYRGSMYRELSGRRWPTGWPLAFVVAGLVAKPISKLATKLAG
jgi:predicted acetyltransferase